LKFLGVSACRAELIGTMFVIIGSLVENSFLGVFFYQTIPGCTLSVKFGTFLITPNFSVGRHESIGMLIVKIGRAIGKLLLRVFFTKIRHLLI
jgi:hypothetical protein